MSHRKDHKVRAYKGVRAYEGDYPSVLGTLGGGGVHRLVVGIPALF